MTTDAKTIKHHTAGAIVLTDAAPVKVLLVHHKKFKSWVEPGGHQEAWENSHEAAIREVREETGVDIAPYVDGIRPLTDDVAHIPAPKYLLEEKISAYGDQPEHYHIDSLYIVRIPEQEVAFDQNESHGIGWFLLEELENMPMLEDFRKILLQEMTQ